MPDREKTINFLKDIEQIIMVCRKEICPPKELQYWTELQEGVADALALLKEQEPAAPGILQDLEGIWSTCPRCKSKLWLFFGMTMEINPDHMPKYCPQCGKALLWTEQTKTEERTEQK